MAKNEVILSIKVDDKGTLSVVAKSAKKATKSLNQTSKAATKTKKSLQGTTKIADRYNKAQKGIHQTGLSAAKGFSKMNQTMGGSSGFVAAYATLAANIFAATAAFNALRGAAQVEQLGKGLQFVGNVAGRNLTKVTEGLRAITGEAVSTAEAMRTVAIGISAGFTGEQLKGLATVAKGASIALGRDMGDALSRLTRGVAKLEPEILDELGILVRLDTATRVYASQMGLAVSALTQFDRQQAFMNATLGQGIEKYGDIAEAIDPNAYEALAASVHDMAVSFGGFLNDTLRLNTVVQFLADNMLALTAVATTLTLSLSRGIAPGMFKMASASAKAAKQTVENNAATIKSIKLVGNSGTKYHAAAEAIKAGSREAKLFKEANNGLSTSIRNSEAALTSLTKANVLDNKAIEEKRILIASLKRERAGLAGIQKSELIATSKQHKANSLELASRGKFVKSFKALRAAKVANSLANKTGAISTGILAKSMRGLGTATFYAAGAAKAAGAAFFAFLPYIGIFITVATILWAFLKDKWFPEDIAQKRIDELIESFSNFTKINQQFADSSAEGGRRLANAYIIYAGVLDEIRDTMTEIATLTDVATAKALVTARKNEQDAKLKLANLIAERKGTPTQEAATFVRDGVVIGEISDPRAELEGAISAATALVNATSKIRREAEEEDAKAIADIRQRGRVQTMAAAIQALEDQATREKALQDSDKGPGPFTIMAEEAVPALKKLELALKGVDKEGNALAEGAISHEEFLTRFTLIQRGANNVRDAFKSIKDATIAFSKEQNVLNQRTKGPFDAILEAAIAIEGKFEQLSAKDSIGNLLISSTRKAELLVELATNLSGLRLNKTFTKDEAGIKKFIKQMQELNKVIAKSSKQVKILQHDSKVLAKATKDVFGGNAIAIDKANAAREEELKLIAAKLGQLANVKSEEAKLSENATEEQRAAFAEKQVETSRAILTLTAKQISINEKLIGTDERRALIAKSALRMQKLINSAKNAERDVAVKRLKVEQQLGNLALGRGARLTSGQEFEVAIEAAKQTVILAKQKFVITLAESEITFIMLRVQLETSKLSIEEKTETLGLLREQLDLVNKIAAAGVRSAEASAESTMLTANRPSSGIGSNRASDLVETVGSALTKGSARLVRAQAEITEAKAIFQEAQVEFAAAAALGSSATKELITQVTADLESAKAAVANSTAVMRQEFIATIAEGIAPMIESLRALGPEGEFAASFAEGALSISSSLVVISNAAASTAEKLAAVVGIIGSMMSIVAASSKAKVAGIDREIAAEQNRDGKSKESLAKIVALEKKADAQKKKQFEINKKMSMASIVISTAAGIMKAIEQGGIFGIVIGAIIAAMGAAQLAIVAGTSYQGGSGISAPAEPSKVSLGERSATIDLATSRSPANELAFQRGESGIGGASNFIPTFTGRAAGGTVGVRVGEQGPEELFIPERSSIIPADDTEQLSNGSTSITFTINAIDAQGVEEVLIGQEQHIINMIRKAANDRGEFFLEDVT